MLSGRALGAVSLMLVALVMVGCEERESVERHDVALDTADDSSAEVDAEQDSLSEDTHPPEDTQVTVPDSSPEDVVQLPRDLVNGTPVRFGHVIDGDTLDVFVGSPAVRVYTVRLKGLAAPECLKESVLTEQFGRRNQCVADDELHGYDAWVALHDMVADKTGYLTCDDVAPGEWCPQDDFGRYLAYIELAGSDLSTQLAWYGHGMSYTSFTASKRAAICAAEAEARAARRGMWAKGTVEQVLAGMHASTRQWYTSHHDSRCDAALGQ